ncbi:ankyrin repeat and protein kinase domain-containing protein 1-like [Hydra vulgaris]|uniref:Ankyrin repeat and protein kinase domain-containing protein 1-like n=1 Tax=Hydra vulgaris TaxID=6087 RepID=A0ABM4DHW3_HYDVU
MDYYTKGPYDIMINRPHDANCVYIKTKKKMFNILGRDQLHQKSNQNIFRETTDQICTKHPVLPLCAIHPSLLVCSATIKSNPETKSSTPIKIKSDSFNLPSTVLNETHLANISQVEVLKPILSNSKQNVRRRISFVPSTYNENQEENKINNRRFSTVSNILRRRGSNTNLKEDNSEKNRTRFFSSPSILQLSVSLPLYSNQQEILDYLQKNIQVHNCKKIRSVLKKKFNLGSYPNSLMHDAAFKCCEKCLKLLIKNGCSISQKDDSGFIPLHAAVMGENIPAVTFLLEHSPHVNETSNDGWTALHLAVMLNNLKIVHSITMHGGNPYLISNLQTTPFKLCIEKKRTLLLDYFICLKQT